MTESSLKGELMKLLKLVPWMLAMRHEDWSRSGTPDITTTGNHMTAWWEAKLIASRFKARGLQDQTAVQLADGGFCRYILYYDVNGQKRTAIAHPRDVQDRAGNVITSFASPIIVHEVETDGIDHRFVVKYMLDVHRNSHDHHRA